MLERAASKAADSTASADSTAFHHPGILMDCVYLVGGAAVSWLAVGFAIVQLGLKLAVRLGPSPHRRSPSCLSQSPHRPAYTAPNLHRSNRPSCHRATWAQARGALRLRHRVHSA